MDDQIIGMALLSQNTGKVPTPIPASWIRIRDTNIKAAEDCDTTKVAYWHN
jgi:hypothetical protein